MIRIALFALLMAACGGSSANAPAPGPEEKKAPPAEDTKTDSSEVPTTCEDACTTYGICWEEVNGGDFSGGGECTSSCNEKSEADKQTYFECIGKSDCDSVAKC